jgi:hypothetical protein
VVSNKKGATRSSSNLRLLLILSAIDLLSSALTAGLVLFVILVGGNAGGAESATVGAAGNGLNEVLAVDLSGKVQLSGSVKISNQGSDTPVSSPADANETSFFKAATVSRRIYLVPTRYSKLSVQSDSPFELIIRPIIGPAVHLFVRCSASRNPLELSITPLNLPECVKSDQTGPLTFSNVSNLVVASQNRSFKFPEEDSPSPFVRRFKIGGQLLIPLDLAVWGVEE